MHFLIPIRKLKYETTINFLILSLEFWNFIRAQQVFSIQPQCLSRKFEHKSVQLVTKTSCPILMMQTHTSGH
jgi:hypothetical protein